MVPGTGVVQALFMRVCAKSGGISSGQFGFPVVGLGAFCVADDDFKRCASLGSRGINLNESELK